MPKRDPVEEAADELYGLPPGEFVRARDERAKGLRADGDREAANAVKALRKPTAAAWALNQITRARRTDLGQLLAAGEELRAAQEELLAGGDRAGFREAAARERDLVAKLSADAAAIAGEAGEGGTGLQEKVADTLHAAALDKATADELQAGRLTREREAIGGFGELGGTPAPARRASRTEPKSQKRQASASKQKSEKRSSASGNPQSQKPSSSAAKQTRQDAERRQRLAAARTDERHARRELDAAERTVQHARERAEAAEAHAREANERARTTAERLADAKREQAAARKAFTRAERARAKAEAGSS